MYAAFFFTILSILLLSRASAQLQGQPLIDSLINTIPLTTDDTTKARVYKRISDLYTDISAAEALKYADIGLKHVTNMKWRKGVGVFNTVKGMLYADRGDYIKAIGHYDIAVAAHTTNKDYYNITTALNNLGTVYMRQAIFDKASEKYFEALELAEKLNDGSLIALCLDNISSLYLNQSNYAKALDYQLKALKYYEEQKNDKGIANGYERLGSVYVSKKDFKNANKYYLMALNAWEQLHDNKGKAIVYGNLSMVIDDLDQKLNYQLKAQAIWDDLAPGAANSVVNLGNIAFTYLGIYRNVDSLSKNNKKHLLQKADDSLQKALALTGETNDLGNYAFLIGARSELEMERGNYKKAYDDIKLHYTLSDSIFSQERKNSIAALEGQREIALRDKQLELNEVTLKARIRERIALIGGITLLSAIGFLLYRQSRKRKKTNTTLQHLNEALDKANKIKATFFAILSHDLRSPLSRLINFLHLQKQEPGLFDEQQAALHQQKITMAAEALLENMETLLLWSKGQMEHFKPLMKAMPASDLFNQLKKIFVHADAVSISYVGDALLYTDEQYLFTIMQNLTANALKALGNKEGGKIEWSAGQENGSNVLRITDNGPGIDNELIAILENDATLVAGKNGLGLHLIRDLAKAIDCIVTVESANGAGTTFCLTMQTPA